MNKLRTINCDLIEFTGLAEVLDRLIVDGEVANGGSVLGAHVADGGPVGDGQFVDTWTEKLDEFTDDAHLAEVFGDGQNDIGGGHQLVQNTGDLVTYHFRKHHGYGLP